MNQKNNSLDLRVNNISSSDLTLLAQLIEVEMGDSITEFINLQSIRDNIDKVRKYSKLFIRGLFDDVVIKVPHYDGKKYDLLKMLNKKKVGIQHIRDLEAFAPTGLNVTYLEMVDVLESVYHRALGTIKEDLIEMNNYIQLVISDNSLASKITTVDKSSTKKDNVIDEIKHNIRKVFEGNNKTDSTTIGYLYRNNGEISDFNNRWAEFSGVIENINMKELSDIIDLIYENLDTLMDDLDANKDIIVNKTFYANMSNSILFLANKVEIYTILSTKTHATTSALIDTYINLKKTLK